MLVARSQSKFSFATDRVGPPKIELIGMGAANTTGRQLPQMVDVLENAASVQKLIDEHTPPPMDVQGFGASTGGESLGMLHPGLVYNTQYPALFQFAYFCQADRVPIHLVSLCIWALEWLLQAYKSASEAQLRALGHILRHQEEDVRSFLMLNARFKIAQHLLNAELDQPKDAANHLSTMFDINASWKNLAREQVMQNSLDLRALYATALARTQENDEEAEEVLRAVLLSVGNVSQKSQQASAMFGVTSRAYLARVLRRRGGAARIAEAQEFEKWLVKWFKKNPQKHPFNYMRDLFGASDVADPDTDPVLAAIGGGGWQTLIGRGLSFNALQRMTRQCRHCRAAEPAVKLSKCGRCKHIFYCSAACQMANWPLHKEMCKEHAASLERVETLASSGDLSAALCTADWVEWRVAMHPLGMEMARAHALGLHRDTSRHKTHLIITQVRYVPGEKELSDRFRAVAMGVFRYADVKKDIEKVMGLDDGECDSFVGEMLAEFDREEARGVKPFLELFISDQKNIQTYITTKNIPDSMLESTTYDPEWRKLANRKGPAPTPLKQLRSGAKDAEHDFPDSRTK